MFRNQGAGRSAYPPELRAVLNIDAARRSRRWLSSWKLLEPGPSPALEMPALARRLGIRRVVVKDESARSSLSSFKVLGAPVALVRLIQRLHPELAVEPEELWAGHYAAELSGLVVISATDGNHGRALAAAARDVGCSCVIVLHQHVDPEREQPIAALGAQIIRVAGNYDHAVDEAARLAAREGWHVVSDTSYPGYETVPRDVMQGYAVMVDELVDSLGPDAPCPYSHVVIQAGVGGLAAGVTSYFCERFAERRPTFIVVEPRQADCLLQSARSGSAGTASGSVDSLMAGLACGKASPLAWRFLANAVDIFLTVADGDAVRAMQRFAGESGDVPLVSGESGAAGLAGLEALCARPDWRRTASLNADSEVLVFNTEGATAPELYRRLTGRTAEHVVGLRRIREAGDASAGTGAAGGDIHG